MTGAPPTHNAAVAKRKKKNSGQEAPKAEAKPVKPAKKERAAPPPRKDPPKAVKTPPDVPAEKSAAAKTEPAGTGELTLLQWVEQNKAAKYALVAALYIVGFAFIHGQETIWKATFDRILERGQHWLFPVYQPVNMPTDPDVLAAMTEEEKWGQLPDPAGVRGEMAAEVDNPYITREELAAPERKGYTYLQEVPPQKAPWEWWQFQQLPPSVYGDEEATLSASEPAAGP